MPGIDDPRQLFVHKLGAALQMEQTVLGILEESEEKAHDAEIKEQLSHHHEETEQQIRNLHQAFSALGAEPQTQPCPPIEGLKEQSEQMTSEVSERLIDSVILGGSAEIEHHEIAVYTGLITKAEAMGEEDIVALLEENLEQEEHTLKEVEKAAQQKAADLAEATA